MSDILPGDLASYSNLHRIPIGALKFDAKYQKLLKRLLLIHEFESSLSFQTLGDIIDTPFEKLYSVRSFGATYCELFRSLQAELSEQSSVIFEHCSNMTSNSGQSDIGLVLSAIPQPAEQVMKMLTDLKVYFKPTSLEEAVRKSLSKIQRAGLLSIRRFYVSELFALDLKAIVSVNGLGKQTFQTLARFREESVFRLSSPSVIEQLLRDQGSDILSETTQTWEPSELESTIISDFENFALALSDTDQTVLCCRLGYNTEFKTLEQVGIALNLTRERVRQLERRQIDRLRSSVGFMANDLLTMLTESPYPLWNLFSRLRSCFQSDRTFLSFLDVMCEREEGFLSKFLTIDFLPSILNDFFCLFQAPVTYEDITSEIQTKLGCTETQCRFVLEKLLADRIIKVNDSWGFSPCVLPVHVAMAQVLLGFPNGLPWKEMVRLCNTRTLTKEVQRLDRLVPDRFTYTGFIVLSGRGEYKHFKYLNFSSAQREILLSELSDFLETFPGQKTGLQIFYNSRLSIREELDYFTCRHIVREYGNEVGVHFNGHSSTDTVSLEKIESLRSQKDELLEHIKASTTPCIEEDLVGLIKSRSLGHLSLYLADLLNEKRIIRVDEKSYWVPEAVLSQGEIELVMERVVSCLGETQMVVEADYFRELFNREMSFSYSKYFYSSLIRYFSENYMIVTKRSLFSLSDFPFSSQREAFDLAASQSRTRHELVERLGQYFLSTRETYVNLLERMGSSTVIENRSVVDL